MEITTHELQFSLPQALTPLYSSAPKPPNTHPERRQSHVTCTHLKELCFPSHTAPFAWEAVPDHLDA